LQRQPDGSEENVPITYELMKKVSADLYGWSLRKVPDDTLAAMERARETESDPVARRTLGILLKSARAAETQDRLVCSDSGVPVYSIKIGTGVRLEGDIKRAISDGFDELIATSNPPLLKHVTNPLTNERGYRGKDMPLITWDVMDGADYVDITCQPKALGSGRWAALEIFTFPSLEQIEKYIMDVVIRAGSQHCPPVIVVLASAAISTPRRSWRNRPPCASWARSMRNRSWRQWRNACSRP